MLSVFVRALSTIGLNSSITLLILFLKIAGTSAVRLSRSLIPAPMLSLGSPKVKFAKLY